MGAFNRFNNWLAINLGNTLSSMLFFYICVLLDVVELPPVIAAHSVIIWCSYISQTVIQLIALPVLGYQQKVSNQGHETTHAHHAQHHADLSVLKSAMEQLQQTQNKEVEWLGVLLRSEIARRERETGVSVQPRRRLT